MFLQNRRSKKQFGMPTISEFLNISTRQDFFTTTVAALLITVGVIIFTNGYSTNAQMVTNNQSGFGNLNISLSQAIITAEQSVGNNSSAIAAFGEESDGGIVYSIILATHGTEFYDVMIDPGNGQVLAKEQLSQQDLERRGT